VQGVLKGEDNELTEGTDTEKVTSESLKLKVENKNTASGMERSSCKAEIETGYVDTPVSEEVKENTREEGVLVKEEKIDVKEDMKSFSVVDNLVQSNKMQACSFPEVKEIKEEINQKPEMGERSKETKFVAIKYKNEASPIKDQKDILKEKQLIASLNKGYLAHYVQKKQNNGCGVKEEGDDIKAAQDLGNCVKIQDEKRRENDHGETQEKVVTDKRNDESGIRSTEEDANKSGDKGELIVKEGNEKILDNSGIERTPVDCSNDETQKEDDNKILKVRGDDQIIGSESKFVSKADDTAGEVDNINNLGDEMLLVQALPNTATEQSDVLHVKDDILCSSELNNTGDTDDDVILAEVEESLDKEELCSNHVDTEESNAKLDLVEEEIIKSAH